MSQSQEIVSKVTEGGEISPRDDFSGLQAANTAGKSDIDTRIIRRRIIQTTPAEPTGAMAEPTGHPHHVTNSACSFTPPGAETKISSQNSAAKCSLASEGTNKMLDSTNNQPAPEGAPAANYSAPNNFTKPERDPGKAASGSHAEAAQEDLIHFLNTGKLPTIFSDDPAFVAQMLSPEGGSTFEEVVDDYHGYRAARRELRAQVLRFAAAVVEDEARRGQSLAGFDAAAVSKINTILADPAIAATHPVFVAIQDRPNDAPPAGIDPQLWTQAGRAEIARIIGCYDALNSIEQDRAWEALHAGKRRSEKPTDEQTERENAWQIALQAADELDYDDALAADPDLDPAYGPDGVIRDIARLHDLTEEEAEAVETAAQVLRKLPRIGYRKPRRKVAENTAESAQDDRTATEGGEVD